ncbi:hypothetical protein HYQ44_005174 [Verticillium longisporum]|nr:hypothetical protein HYQ44_005174 [Verticillium longisporum]
MHIAADPLQGTWVIHQASRAARRQQLRGSSQIQVYKYQAPVVYLPKDLLSSLIRRTSLKTQMSWRRSTPDLLISDLKRKSRTGTAYRCWLRRRHDMGRASPPFRTSVVQAERTRQIVWHVNTDNTMDESPHSFQGFDEAQASPLYDLMAEVGYSDFDKDTVTTVITPYSFAYASRPAPLEDPFIDDPFVDDETPAISSVTHLPQPSDSDTKARITSWLDAVDPIVAPPRPPSPDLYPLEPMGSSSNSTPHEDAALAAPAAAAAPVSQRMTVTVLGPGFIGRMPRPATVEFQALLLAGLLAVLLAPRMTLILVCSVSLSRLGEKALYGGNADGRVAGCCAADELEGYEAGRRVGGVLGMGTW